MDLEHILLFGVPCIAGIIGYLGKLQMQRIDDMEKALAEKITETQARQILSDKLDPIKESLDRIQEMQDKVYFKILKIQE